VGEIDRLEADLKVAAAILEWETGDIWGHVAARIPGEDAIAAKLLRNPNDPGVPDWLVRFDYDLNKISGVGTVPMESAIHSETLKARPDMNAVVHCHPPMCIALSIAGKTVMNVDQRSRLFGKGVPVFPDPIFIIDPEDGQALAETLGDAHAVIIRGHGIVTVGRSVDEACIAAMYMERSAKIQVMAHMMGYEGPDDDFLEKIQETAAKVRERRTILTGKPIPDVEYSPEWKYYSALVAKGERWNRGLI
jgi:ribulose-5-phosphate 4-epimerase/fuculose-1-phosphate aldolase